MKKLSITLVMMAVSLITGSAFAGQERPRDQRPETRMEDRRPGEARRRIRRMRRRHRRYRRHQMMNPGADRRRGEGNHRPPSP